MSEFSQVTQGQPFGFPATLYNRLIDSAIGDLTKNQQPQGLPRSYEFTRGGSQFVRVFNNSGIDIREFSPIGLEGLIFTPGDTPGDKKESDFIGNNYIFEGIKPDETKHKMKFAMTQERILDQQTGICVIDGLTIARIAMAAPQSTDEVARVGILTDDTVNLHQTFWGAEVLFIDKDEIIDESFSHWVLIKMGRHQPISGIPGKAQAAISAGATGDITEALADGTEIGPDEPAVNYGSSVANNDEIVWGVDQEGSVFFIPAKAAGVCGPGDCPDSCDNNIWCFEVFWQQGTATGSFFVQSDCFRECIGFNDFIFDPPCEGTAVDPVTGRSWTLTSTWDICGQIVDFELVGCDGVAFWQQGAEPISVGGTCPNSIDITSVAASPGNCVGTSTFPCCDSSEGCTCL